FSSRRRHTRFSRDWSSDVCSSDLVLAGDVIVAIDGKPIAQVEGSEPLRGPAGSKVTITILREGRERPFDIEIQRETIRVTSVRSRMLEPGYGYVRLSTFQADTGADFRKHLDELQAKAGARLRASHVKISYAVFCLKK